MSDIPVWDRPLWETCPACKGLGWADVDAEVRCNRCQGHGDLRLDTPEGVNWEEKRKHWHRSWEAFQQRKKEDS